MPYDEEDEYVVDFNDLESVFEDLRRYDEEDDETNYGAVQASLYVALEDHMYTGGADALNVARHLERGEIDEAQELTEEMLE
jgi:hypothetical protein